jgi:hypothetical protein
MVQYVSAYIQTSWFKNRIADVINVVLGTLRNLKKANRPHNTNEYLFNIKMKMYSLHKDFTHQQPAEYLRLCKNPPPSCW